MAVRKVRYHVSRRGGLAGFTNGVEIETVIASAARQDIAAKRAGQYVVAAEARKDVASFVADNRVGDVVASAANLIDAE